jgi:NAD+ synthase (glutamine-hydrolysing)
MIFPVSHQQQLNGSSMLKDFGYLRVAAAKPLTEPVNIKKNTDNIILLMKESSDNLCNICVYPELSVTSYNCGELFRQQILLDSATTSIIRIIRESLNLSGIHIIGFPFAENGQLFNCAAVISRGELLGIVSKSYIPNNNEYYEGRWFSTGLNSEKKTVSIGGLEIPFGSDLIFSNKNNKLETFGIEICEDLWSVIPPSSSLALGGASLIFNLSASTDILGKAAYRKNLVKHQSGSIIGGYIYCSAGVGESSTDTVCAGHSIIAENGKILIENERFNRNSELIYSEIDLEYLHHERLNNATFSQSINNHNRSFRKVYYNSEINSNIELSRFINPHPFIPDSSNDLRERSREILNIQSSALATRMSNISCTSAVIGLSGGLDSTLALLVTIEAFKKINLNFSGIRCITMPGFGTTARTKNNVTHLCKEMDISLIKIDITKASLQHFKDIEHDSNLYDITFENTQARERTQILMDKANQLNGLVIGTGDLSELALGWCTYNGDQMSMYSVNSGVPKTLVKFLIEYFADSIASGKAKDILKDIIKTPISPELLPPGEKGEIIQKTEDTIGPYQLHDFFIFNAVRCAFKPEKVFFLAKIAFKNDYSPEIILKWLRLYYKRFFSQQFKRSAMPDGPKVGTLSLSPRGDWKMPSDANVSTWLDNLSGI